jgi:isoleucyl-tRNA synthetase
MTVSDEIFKRTADSYRRIRNTARFLLANHNGFEPDQHALAFTDMLALDRWIVDAAFRLQREIVAAYDTYQFHLVYQKVHNFCVVELGSFYLDVIKDRQYTTQRNSRARRSAQTALYHIVEALARWIAPVLSFTAEELWRAIPGRRDATVFTAEWYEGLQELPAGEPLGETYWQQLMEVKSAVNRVLEGQRREGLIGGTLEAEVTLYADGALLEQLRALGDELRFALITSQAWTKPLAEAQQAVATEVEGLKLQVVKSAQPKCVRCWHHREEVGSNPAHPELCGRCVDNVDGSGEARQFA